MVASCGASSGMRGSKKENQKQIPALSAEEQRRFDYYFLEAIRLKGQDEYAAAFDMLQHFVNIDPNASAALYEISQYYLFLKQNNQAMKALEGAVANAPDNYWYSQALSNTYLQKDDKQNAINLLESMAQRLDRKSTRLNSIHIHKSRIPPSA